MEKLSKKQVESRYEKLLQRVKEDGYYDIDLTDRTNAYNCEVCGHRFITKDVDPGCTPFMHNCEKCGIMSKSEFYENPESSEKATQEWYRPSLEECIKLRKDIGILNHVFNGGLLNRLVKPTSTKKS